MVLIPKSVAGIGIISLKDSVVAPCGTLPFHCQIPWSENSPNLIKSVLRCASKNSSLERSSIMKSRVKSDSEILPPVFP